MNSASPRGPMPMALGPVELAAPDDGSAPRRQEAPGLCGGQIRGCGKGGHTYAGPMTVRQKRIALAGLVAALLGLTGCGGINANGSASPAMFLLERTPQRPAPAAQPAPVVVASADAPRG